MPQEQERKNFFEILHRAIKVQKPSSSERQESSRIEKSIEKQTRQRKTGGALSKRNDMSRWYFFLAGSKNLRASLYKHRLEHTRLLSE